MTRSLLDAPAPERASLWPLVFTVGAHVLIAAAVGAVVIRPQVIGQVAALAEFIDIEAPEPEPPQPPPAAEPETLRPVQVSPRVQSKPEPRPEPPEPKSAAATPPAAAQAAEALTQEHDVVDLSNTIVVGSGAKYGGGTTDPNGTSNGAVRALGARGGGAGVGKGPAMVPKPAPSLARAPRLAGGASWSCPFPPEADVADVNRATVALRVSVSADGSVSDVSVSSEPGYGFGRAAKRCAMNKRWDPGLDATGRAVGAVAVVNVRFVR